LRGFGSAVADAGKNKVHVASAVCAQPSVRLLETKRPALDG
jgi:hypothetical protein